MGWRSSLTPSLSCRNETYGSKITQKQLSKFSVHVKICLIFLLHSKSLVRNCRYQVSFYFWWIKTVQKYGAKIAKHVMARIVVIRSPFCLKFRKHLFLTENNFARVFQKKPKKQKNIVIGLKRNEKKNI